MPVSVIGGGRVTDEEYAMAERLGRELGHALDFDRPAAGLGTHRIEGTIGERIEHVETVEEAVDFVEREG